MSANLTASDVIVSATPGYDVDTSPDGRIGKHIYASLAFGAGDNSLTYPAYGVPLPDPGKFGMNLPVPYRWVDFRYPVNGFLYTYDATPRTGAPYGTIRIIVASNGVEVATNAAVGVTDLAVRVTGK